MKTSAPANGKSTNSIKQRREKLDVRRELDTIQRKLARTERALESLSRILTLVPDPIEVILPDYTVMFANRASRLLHDNDRLEGSSYYKTVMGLDEPPQDCPIRRAVDDDRETAYTAACENGDVYEVAVTPIILADGRRAALSISKPMVFKGVTDNDRGDGPTLAKDRLTDGEDVEQESTLESSQATLGSEEEQIQILQKIAELSSLTLDAVLAQVTDGVLLANTSGRPILFNDAFTDLTGYTGTTRETAEKSLAAVLFPDDGADADTFDTATARCESKRLKTEVINKEGVRTAVEMAISRIRGDTDSDTVILVTLRNLSEPALRDAPSVDDVSSSLVNERVANLIRQVSKYLSPAIDQVDTLAQRRNLDNATRHVVSSVEDNLNLCRESLSSVLALARPPVATAININQLVSEVFSKDRLAEELRDDNIEIVQRYDPAVLETVGYRALLQQALVNVIKFSRDAMANGQSDNKRLMVLTESAGSTITIRINDSGPGIAKNVKSAVSANAGEADARLRFAEEIIARHDGVIEMKSKPNEGSVFEIRLPVRKLKASDAPEAR